jgi:hypothetical protein
LVYGMSFCCVTNFYAQRAVPWKTSGFPVFTAFNLSSQW